MPLEKNKQQPINYQGSIVKRYHCDTGVTKNVLPFCPWPEIIFQFDKSASFLG